MGGEGFGEERDRGCQESGDLWGELRGVRGVGGVGLYAGGVRGRGILCRAVEPVYFVEFDSAVLGVGAAAI